jgi:hypothetical protein
MSVLIKMGTIPAKVIKSIKNLLRKEVELLSEKA